MSDRDTPSSDPPAFDDDITGNYSIPHEIKPLARRVRKIERHFEPHGMVFEIRDAVRDLSAEKRVKSESRWWIPIAVTILIAVLGAAVAVGRLTAPQAVESKQQK